MIALVRRVRRFTMAFGSMQWSSGLTSAKTGMAPAWRTHMLEAMKV